MSLSSPWRVENRIATVVKKQVASTTCVSHARCPLRTIRTAHDVSYTPLQIRTAYGYNDIVYGSVNGTGAGQTIAIIDQGDDANFVNRTDPNFGKSDLAMFDAERPPEPAELQSDRRRWWSASDVCESGRQPGRLWRNLGRCGVGPCAGSRRQHRIDRIDQQHDSDRARALSLAVPAVGATVVSMSFGDLGDQQRYSARPPRRAFRSRPQWNRATR